MAKVSLPPFLKVFFVRFISFLFINKSYQANKINNKRSESIRLVFKASNQIRNRSKYLKCKKFLINQIFGDVNGLFGTFANNKRQFAIKHFISDFLTYTYLFFVQLTKK